MATPATRERLSPEVFRLPVERISSGYYTDAYFNFTKELLGAENHRPNVLMQVFQKRDQTILGGIDEAIAVLKQCAGCVGPDGSWQNGWDKLEVRALSGGDEVDALEPVMTIGGDSPLFAPLETVSRGSPARRSLVMKNVRDVVD